MIDTVFTLMPDSSSTILAVSVYTVQACCSTLSSLRPGLRVRLWRRAGDAGPVADGGRIARLSILASGSPARPTSRPLLIITTAALSCSVAYKYRAGSASRCSSQLTKLSSSAFTSTAIHHFAFQLPFPVAFACSPTTNHNYPKHFIHSRWPSLNSLNTFYLY